MRGPLTNRLSPGSTHLVSVERAVSDIVLSGKTAQASAIPFYSHIAEQIDGFSRLERIVMSLDCVVFEDGQFVGPDVVGHFAQLQAQAAGEAEFISDLKRLVVMPEAQLTTFLDEILKMPPVNHLLGSGSDNTRFVPSSPARSAKRRLQEGGRSALAAYVQQLQPTPKVWR